MKSYLVAMLPVLLMAFAPTLGASVLLNDSITLTGFRTDTNAVHDGPHTTTVSAGTGDLIVVDAGFGFPHFEVNAEDEFIDWKYVALNTGFGSITTLWEFSGIDTTLTSVSMIGLTGTVSGFDASDVYLNGNNIVVDMRNSAWDNATGSPNFTIALNGYGVPAPATVILLAIGIAGVTGIRRLR